MADLDISEHRKPQDGKIDFARFGGPRVELRMVTVPTARGLEDVVLRLLSGLKPMPLDEIGLTGGQPGGLRSAMAKAYGLILICGPTGCGKTTTLHSVMRELNTERRKIWTAEDPVEITQEGLRQVQVNARIGWTFAAAMRTFLRADPDIIMIGEMRDEETARIAVEASLTGPPGDEHAAHQFGAREHHAAAGDRPGPLHVLRLAAGRAGTAAGAPAVPALPQARTAGRRLHCSRWPTSTWSAATASDLPRPSCRPAGARPTARDRRACASTITSAVCAAKAPVTVAAWVCTSCCWQVNPCANASATASRPPNCRPVGWLRACSPCARTVSKRCWLV
jgi:energy-coupling factor transporter ATP-binding protein EcfA2